jgi:DNA-directed RNA polymerase specialized sigma24 family protein
MILMGLAIARKAIKPDLNPSAYLITIARNRAIDAVRAELRNHRRTQWAGAEELREVSGHEADLVQAISSVQEVAAALRLVDDTARRVITAFLDLAALTGERPPAHAVAEAAGVSRKTVFAALDRFRAALHRTNAGEG